MAIIQAIQGDNVQTGMRKDWHRVGKWESRVLNDLIAFTSSSRNYRFIRESMAAMAESRFSVASHASATSSGDHKPKDTKPSCIPLLSWFPLFVFTVHHLPTLRRCISQRTVRVCSTTQSCRSHVSIYPPHSRFSLSS